MPVRHPKIDDVTDVWVHELRRGFCFAAETFAHACITRQVLMEYLEHDRTIERGVDGIVYRCHPTISQPMRDAVPATDHMAERSNIEIWLFARRFDIWKCFVTPKAARRCSSVP
jgi:hypothetical protein